MPRRRVRALALTLLVSALVFVPGGPASGQSEPSTATGFSFFRHPAPQPLCTGVALAGAYFSYSDCGFGEVAIAGAQPADAVTAEFRRGSELLGTADATHQAADDNWQFAIEPAAEWGPGPVEVRVRVADQLAEGAGTFFVNTLGAELAPEERSGGYRPGEDIPLTGRIFEQRSVGADTQETGVPATFKLRAVDAHGAASDAYGPFTAASDGSVTATLPGAATAGLAPGRDTDYRETVALELVDATYDDPDPVTGNGGTWGAPDGTPAGRAQVSVTPTELVLTNAFTSSVGWVKPGETYPFRLTVENFRITPATGAQVVLAVPPGTTLQPPAGGGATVSGDTLTWNVGTVPAGTADGPGTKSLVAEATVETLAQDPEVVWKDLSSIATLTYDGGPAGLTDRSHGPKVIPPKGGYETARYGDRPFPVVPVDFSDRKHGDGHTASTLAGKINDPENPGSTFNLFQEMSYGQLFPHGTVPSDGVASAGWDYGPGFAFTKNSAKADTCRGITAATLPGDAYQQTSPERIAGGWYQLPGSTDYYGDDAKGSAVIGSVAGVGALQDIDSACGPTGKAVFDAAQIADPEIDYDDYDTDKDGVVDFFMMVFPGAGGNGESQLQGYDNIWPHSADLQNAYVDGEGQKGYVTDDQLTDLEGRPLFWTDDSRSARTTDDTGIPVHVRVGPYNVNPESAIEKASVISHEYGHSLGLPDYYSTGSRETYGTWTLMASDHSQNMDIIGKKELGWVVPEVLGTGETKAEGWQDTKRDSHRIAWQRPDGSPYTLEGEDVHNGQAYVATLPGRQILDPALVPSGSRVWWSRAGNDFGCPPSGGHNLDIALPGLADVPAGTPVTLQLKSRWDIEWDYDYGFVLTSTDSGKSYVSHASENGYTTEGSQNPNSSGCQGQYGNGLTGSSGSYKAGTQTTDRVLGEYPEGGFVDDAYDLTALAGERGATLRLSYATDPGLARPGWFIDDLRVLAGDRVVYESDFESSTDTAIYNGGCREGLQTAQQCTDGWQQVTAGEGSPAEHAYLLELRDRSGFDLRGRGESDRGDPTFAPGVLLAYTDENHGYGNVGTDDPPAQSPLDSQPEPGSETPNLDDAAFTAAAGDAHFSDGGEGHVDNYSDPSQPDGAWRFAFDCLGFDVTRMTGDGPGPEELPPYDLDADVTFTGGAGCGTFDYGTGGEAGDMPPTAVAQAKPLQATVGQEVRFDGSGSSDDRDAPGALGYAWDFDGNGTRDAESREARHAYDSPGSYRAALAVTDSAGHRSEATVTISVTGGGAGQPAAPGGPAAPGPGCAVASAFRSLKARPRGRGVRFAFTPRTAGATTVDIFRAATPTRVIARDRVARFVRPRSFTWRAKGAPNGLYWARLKAGADVRRIVLRRARGRFTVHEGFVARRRCGLIRAFALNRPAFSRGKPLRLRFALAPGATTRITVLRHGKVLRRVTGRRVRARGLPRGQLRIRLSARRGAVSRTATLTARRL